MNPTSAERAMPNMQGRIRALMISFASLSAIFIGLRFASRLSRNIKTGVDDWLLLAAQFFLFALLTSGLLMVHWGLGIHTAELTTLQLVNLGKTLIAFECLYVTSVAFVKVSLVVMFRHIFPVRSVNIGACILGAIAVSWAVSIIFVCIFQCTPIEKAWNPSLPGTCINLKGSFIGNAVPNIVTDILILSLPIPQVWRLHITTYQRLSLCIIFLLGSFVVFTSIYRFTTLFAFIQSDISWTLATPCAWTVVEAASGIISACLPTLGPLFQLLGLRLGLSSNRLHSRPSVDLMTIGGSRKRSQATTTDDDIIGRHSDCV